MILPQNFISRPLCERREILRKNMTEVKNHVMFSEMKEINVSFVCHISMLFKFFSGLW